MRERNDYILGTDRHHFGMLGIRGVRNYASDKFALRDMLLKCPTEAGHHFDTGDLPE